MHFVFDYHQQSGKDDDDLPPAVSEFNQLRRDVQQLHIRLHTHLADCEKHKITLVDLEAVLKRMNVTTMSKKQMVSVQIPCIYI